MKASETTRYRGLLKRRVCAVLTLGTGTMVLGGCPPPPSYTLTVAPASSTIPAAGTVTLTLTPLYGATAHTGTLNASGAGGCGTLSATSVTANATTPTPTITFTGGTPTTNCTETVTATIPGRVFGSAATATATILVTPAPASTTTLTGWSATGAAPTVSVTPSVTPQTWAYVVDVKTNAGAVDYLVEVFVDLDVACPIPKSTAGGTITPASGPNDHWLVKYSGNTTTTDTITFTCDAKPGGTAKFDIRVDDIKYSASLSVTGPKQ